MPTYMTRALRANDWRYAAVLRLLGYAAEAEPEPETEDDEAPKPRTRKAKAVKEACE
ncbi:hypothetical protein HNR59_002886 [Aquamicrobium lusatiense]|uniref:Uncharacterized protein n=1 Tax=Aquamicrobium lusatiense TaxID=89772 RepID=A0A7W9S3N7_9HYPH|nr:hypothetical protein [Aquamicrobium lusatiense]MBB6013497.1 hypothetical protein [Aquamicrobium lusatiense]